MEDKGLVDADRMNFRQADAARRLGTAEVGARSQAARAVGAQASAENVAAQTEVLVPKTKAGMAKDYGIAANANASANQTKMLAPWRRANLIKQYYAEPKEVKGFSLTIGGKGVPPEEVKLYRKLRDEAQASYTDAEKYLAKIIDPPNTSKMSREEAAKTLAQHKAKVTEAKANAAMAYVRGNMSRDKLDGVEFASGKKYADTVGVDPKLGAAMQKLWDDPEFKKLVGDAEAQVAGTGSTPTAPTDPTNNSRYAKPGEE
jgi:hypothetical protein